MKNGGEILSGSPTDAPADPQRREVLLGAALSLYPFSTEPTTFQRSSMNLPLDPNAPADFDFFMGSWRVRHKRLKERLVGATEWEQFNGLCVAHKTLGGFGNIDDNMLELPAGAYRAVTMRAYDPKAKTWSIWWLDARHPGALDVPVVGRFENGVGTFLANDTLNGKPIVVRFLWSLPKPSQPRWEQAFSPDGGKSWETNWVMDFVRLK
jgi:hypothetical protein